MNKEVKNSRTEKRKMNPMRIRKRIKKIKRIMIIKNNRKRREKGLREEINLDNKRIDLKRTIRSKQRTNKYKYNIFCNLK